MSITALEIMECSACSEIELKPYPSGSLIEWECGACGHYETSDDPDYDPTPDEGEPPITWQERAAKVRSR